MDPITVPRPSPGLTSPHRHTRSRTQSISSDRPSTIGNSLMSPPLSVSPEAAFIAASAASQIVTSDHDSHADRWYDQHGLEPSGETVLVSTAALQLVNNFLDQLLFNFLSIARSTSLTSLRPAVTEVLKPKLAKDAINNADEELREYLGSGDDEDLLQSSTADSGRDWDLELIWKRTRLRCMVYSSLGDMEEEDEDYYMDQEQLEETGRISDLVSPAVAIFLTSILEFMGEQALIVAGQAAYHRMRVKHEKELKDGLRGPSDLSDRIVVEELDMERVALDRTLGRLWRAWKKRIRSPTLEYHGLHRTLSRGSMRSGKLSLNHLRQGDSVHEEGNPSKSPGGESAEPEITPTEKVEEYIRASQIPLPMKDNDVDEIEVPGLVSYSDDEDDEAATEPEEKEPPRPKSLIILPTAINDLPTPTMSQPVTPVVQTRKRSNSLPTPAASPYDYPAKRSKMEQQIPTPVSGDVTESAPESGPIPMEEIRPQPHAADESPEELAPSGATDELEDPEATLTKPSRRPAPIATPSKTETQDDVGDIEEFTEEPQVLNFSRVSVAGRSSPASSASSISGKPPPVNTALPVRTPSMHSARLIDVSTPRTPRSLHGSVAAEGREPQDNHSPVVVLPPTSMTIRSSRQVSRANSNSSQPPAAGELEKRSNPENVTGSAPRTAAPSPLTCEPESNKMAPAPERTSSKQRPTDFPTVDLSVDQRKAVPPALRTPTSQTEPIFGSVPRQSPSPRANKQSVTRVTIISSPPTSGGTFLDMDDRPEAPKSASPHREHGRRDVLPPVPERSINRQANGPVPQSSIGRPSVERFGRESPEKPREENKAAPRQIRHGTEGSTSTMASGKFKSRSSEESARARDRGELARNFEELMKSDQTIQFTLTPESARDTDAQSTRSQQNGSPVIPVKVRKSDDRPSATRSRSSSDNKSISELKRTASVNRQTVSSHPQGPIPRSNDGKPRTIGVARDARATRESMADFAKWIRSTGPDSASAAPSQLSMSGAATSVVSKPGADMRRLNSASSGAGNGATRPRLLARAATVSSQDDNSDLIDFIRRGPPSNDPRIPRAVAPFRTTMDSDQLTAAVGGKAIDANLPDIRYSGGTAQTEPSTHSSVDSRSALLASGVKPALQSGHSAAAGADYDGMIPKRTRRVARDSRAVNYSDDDSDADLFERPPPKQVAKEESLAEFLRNYEPPPPPPSPPRVNKPRKKSSAPSLMARLTRNHHNTAANTPASVVGSVNTAVSSRGSNGTRKYIPIQVNMPAGSETYGNHLNNLATQSGSAIPDSIPGPGRGVPMKKFQPREAVGAASRTSDLAEFLMSTGPPGGSVPSAGNLANLPEKRGRRKF